MTEDKFKSRVAAIPIPCDCARGDCCYEVSDTPIIPPSLTYNAVLLVYAPACQGRERMASFPFKRGRKFDKYIMAAANEALRHLGVETG